MVACWACPPYRALSAVRRSAPMDGWPTHATPPRHQLAQSWRNWVVTPWGRGCACPTYRRQAACWAGRLTKSSVVHAAGQLFGGPEASPGENQPRSRERKYEHQAAWAQQHLYVRDRGTSGSAYADRQNPSDSRWNRNSRDDPRQLAKAFGPSPGNGRFRWRSRLAVRIHGSQRSAEIQSLPTYRRQAAGARASPKGRGTATLRFIQWLVGQRSPPARSIDGHWRHGSR